MPTRSGSPCPSSCSCRRWGWRLFEPVVRGLDVEVLRGGEPVFRDVEARRPIPQDHEAAGVLIGKGRKKRALATLKIAVLAPMPMASDKDSRPGRSLDFLVKSEGRNECRNLGWSWRVLFVSGASPYGWKQPRTLGGWSVRRII